jgi:hypothetical protein
MARFQELKAEEDALWREGTVSDVPFGERMPPRAGGSKRRSPSPSW